MFFLYLEHAGQVYSCKFRKEFLPHIYKTKTMLNNQCDEIY